MAHYKRIAAAIGRALVLAIIIPGTACAKVPAASARAAAAKPAMWMIGDQDTTIYLFGSMHMLPAKLAWRTPVIERAIAKSDALVLETVIGNDPSAIASDMARLGISATPLPPVIERVPAPKRAALAKMIAASKIPPALLDRFETWAAALAISSAQLSTLPAARDAGVEATLTNAFTTAKKPVSGLETPAEQLGYFDALPESAQRAFLATIADDDKHQVQQFDAMVSAWKRGDTDRIAASFDDEMKATPELEQALLYQRNARWTTWLAKRLDTPGTIFVAVGAGHLAGPKSVVKMLEARGIKVRRVE